MSRCQWLAVLVVLSAVSPIPAQIIVAPPPGWGVVGSRGFGISYHRRNPAIYGGIFVPAYGPYFSQAVEQRVIVTQPPVFALPRQYEYDLSGIDLDVEEGDIGDAAGRRQEAGDELAGALRIEVAEPHDARADGVEGAAATS